jgi:DNA-binding winged helix-turn-helix (wHTH) protein/TolB-like protein/Tfp pilus assembly protein PilF
MEQKAKGLYEFGPFRLDAGERLLLRAGEAVSLTPKAFDLLLALLEQPGHLREKEELMQAVWPDSFVEENNLADNISRIRKALGEGENGLKFIETVPKRGYRFVAEVRAANGVTGSEPVTPKPAQSLPPASAPLARPRAFWLASAALALTVVFYLFTCALAWRYGATDRFGYRTRLRAGQQTIQEVHPRSPAAGRLESGDRIVALDGDTRFSRVEPAVRLQTLPEGQSYTLRVQRGASELAVTLAATTYPTADVARWQLIVTHLLRALVCLAVALLLLWLKPNEAFALLACAAFLTIGVSEMRETLNPLREQLTGSARVAVWLFWALTGGHLLILFAYQTAYRFPPEAFRPRRFWTVLQGLLYAGLVIGASRSFVTRLFGELPQNLELLFRGAPLFAAINTFADWYYVIGLAAIAAVLTRNFLATTEMQQRRRMQWVIAGTLTAIVALAAVELARLGLQATGREAAMNGARFRWLSWAANAVALAFPLSWLYAILNRQLYDVRFVIGRDLQYLLAKNALRVLLALPLLGLAGVLYANRHRSFADLFFADAFWFYLALLTAAACALAYRRELNDWLDRRFLHESEPVAASLAHWLRRPVLMAGAAGLLAISLAGVGVYRRAGLAPVRSSFNDAPLVAAGQAASLAILPFSAAPPDEFLADGIAENLTNTLAHLTDLRVTARALAFRYKGQDADPVRAGRELNARYVLTGNVGVQQEQMTVRLELVDANSGAHVWGERYQRPLAALIDLQVEISRHLAEQLRLPLSGADERQLAKRSTDNQQAYQLFLAGRYHWDKNTPASRLKALAAFGQAWRQDTQFALAGAWLSAAFLQLGINGEMAPLEAKAQAQTHAAQALALDEEQDVAHIVQGALKLFFEWDAAGAERALARGLALNPHNVEGCLVQAYYLLFVGQTDQALAEVKRGQQLDPFSLLLKTSAASMFYYARRYDEALAECRAALELEPNYGSAHYWQARAYIEKSQPAEALTAMRRWLALTGRDEQSSPDLGVLYAATGQRAVAQKILARLQQGHAQEAYVDPFDNARLCLLLGDREQCFVWLEQALQRRSMGMMWLKLNPQFDGLRADLRFDEVVKRVAASR